MVNFFKTMRKITTFMGGLFFLSGCVSVLPETAPPAPRYIISAVNFAGFADSSSPDVGWSLVVDDPTSSQLYNSVKVALTREANRFEFFVGSEWADRAPVLFQKALVRSFENSGRILNVGDFSSLPISDYVLKTDIRAFHVDYINGNPVVTVEIYARLTSGAGNIEAVQLFTGTKSIDVDDLSAIMNGFDEVLDQVLTDMVRWSLEDRTAPAVSG